MKWFLSLLLIATAAARGELPVRAFCEERWKDDDLALFDPRRMELICRSGAGGPWGFCFAGFETETRGPIEIEVTGSGLYESHDMFSIAALSLDFGKTGGGWSQRTLIGLGLIGGGRPPHPPGWGAGGDGKIVCRPSLIKADPKPQSVTIDLAKHAPADWDGRLWIGLMLHNAGAGKSLTARIVKPPPPSGAAPLSEADRWKLLKDHQKQFIERAIAKIEQTPARPLPVDGIAPEMRPYAAADIPVDNPPTDALRKARDAYDKSPAGSQGFLKLAEDFYAWERRSSRPRPADRFNAFLTTWNERGQIGKTINCVIRIATNLDKVWLSEIDTGAIVPTSRAIEIAGARNEHEGFQVVLTPLPGAAENVSLRVSDITSDTGETIPSSAFTINPVGYVKIYPRTDRQRYVPDPLLIGPIPPLKPGENQPVWISVHVPPTAKAGYYRGTVTISAAGKDVVNVPLQLRVRDFEIPKKISLRSSFWIFRDQINRFYHLDEVALDDYFKWIDFALEHRVNPIDVYEGQCKPLLDISLPRQTWDMKNTTHIGEPNPQPDWTTWDKYLDRMIAGGANTLNLGHTHHFGSFFKPDAKSEGTPQHVERVKQAVAIMAQHYQERGLLDMHYLQLRDETSEPASLNVYRGVHEAFPQLKTLLTVPSKDARPFVSIACPQTQGFDASWRDEAHAKGSEYWWYVCLSPEEPYANLMLHQTTPQHRALFWQTWSHGVDGLLYWGLNFWAGYEAAFPPGAKCQTTRLPAPDAPSVIPIPDHPGDGFSMYPGPSPGQPMSSIRLEAMRDGEEDYEYFVMLDALIARAAKAGRSDSVLSEAKSAREDAKRLVESLTEYGRRPEPYLKIRDRVAESIEKLTSATPPK